MMLKTAVAELEHPESGTTGGGFDCCCPAQVRRNALPTPMPEASGGIRDWATAQAMVDAGAARLGLSGTWTVLGGGTSSGY